MNKSVMRGRQLYDYYFNTFKEIDSQQTGPIMTSIDSLSAFITPNKIYIDPTSQNLYHKSMKGVPIVNEVPKLKPKIETNELTGEVIVSIPNDSSGEAMEFQTYNTSNGVKIVVSPNRN
jgi:hypothetical protein